MEKICGWEKCTSCKACSNICPQDAIEFIVNDLGQVVPQIDSAKCIDCGLCIKTCPVNNPIVLNNINKCYAAWTNDKDDRVYSSSGGIATAFARSILDKGGKVFGAAFTVGGELRLEIKAAETEEDLLQFRGSKYVQSDVCYTYREVRKLLETGREVLYIAMPCQIAGLRSFLKKEYDNLYTIDIICHGMPPMLYLQEHIKHISKNNAVDRLTFRGEYDYQLALFCDGNNKPFYKKPSNQDTYFISFLNGLIHKESCYECIYAQPNRTGDITIGDFWGLNKETLKEDYKGRISVLLVNTDKGKKILDICSEQIHLEEREVREAVNGNAQLRRPSVCHTKRTEFETEYRKHGFSKTLTVIGIERTVRLNKIINIIKCLLRPIKRMAVRLLK